MIWLLVITNVFLLMIIGRLHTIAGNQKTMNENDMHRTNAIIMAINQGSKES